MIPLAQNKFTLNGSRNVSINKVGPQSYKLEQMTICALRWAAFQLYKGRIHLYQSTNTNAGHVAPKT